MAPEDPVKTLKVPPRVQGVTVPESPHFSKLRARPKPPSREERELLEMRRAMAGMKRKREHLAKRLPAVLQGEVTFSRASLRSLTVPITPKFHETAHSRATKRRKTVHDSAQGHLWEPMEFDFTSALRSDPLDA
eukprot:GABV01012188.1.p1 GENE.GABV01012188.1~~GABV01012188.1.p1  ORF type:complete len:142 (-),score=39.72 GABV01012188.1:3-404(-)